MRALLKDVSGLYSTAFIPELRTIANESARKTSAKELQFFRHFISQKSSPTTRQALKMASWKMR
jgi:hypothetical protein